MKTDSALKERAIAVARFFFGRKFNTWIAATAAVLVCVCIVFGINYYNNKSLENIATQYENEFVMSDFSRGDSEDIDAKLQK